MEDPPPAIHPHPADALVSKEEMEMVIVPATAIILVITETNPTTAISLEIMAIVPTTAINQATTEIVPTMAINQATTETVPTTAISPETMTIVPTTDNHPIARADQEDRMDRDFAFLESEFK